PLFPYTTLFRSFPHVTIPAGVGKFGDGGPNPLFPLLVDVQANQIRLREIAVIVGLLLAAHLLGPALVLQPAQGGLFHLSPRFEHLDRKSTRLNSSHVKISYAVFYSKKKNIQKFK